MDNTWSHITGDTARIIQAIRPDDWIPLSPGKEWSLCLVCVDLPCLPASSAIFRPHGESGARNPALPLTGIADRSRITTNHQCSSTIRARLILTLPYNASLPLAGAGGLFQPGFDLHAITSRLEGRDGRSAGPACAQVGVFRRLGLDWMWSRDASLRPAMTTPDLRAFWPRPVRTGRRTGIWKIPDVMRCLLIDSQAVYAIEGLIWLGLYPSLLNLPPITLDRLAPDFA